MARRSSGRFTRQAPGSLALAAALAACGGGDLLAVLQIVTPLAGQWSDASGNENISFLTPPPDQQVFSAQVDVTARVTSLAGVCGDTTGVGVEVAGTVDNGQLSLRLPGAPGACLEGRFTDLRRLDAVALAGQPARSYFNSRVDVRLQAGLWVSENGQMKLKFEGPSSVNNDSSAIDNADNTTGCDVSVAASPVRFTGTMLGFNTGTLAVPTIAELRRDSDSTVLLRNVRFVDGARIELLNASGQGLTLIRQTDPAGTTCPAP